MSRSFLQFLAVALLAILPAFAFAQITCTPGGNLFVYSNYDGGVLNIDVNVNIPNIKIGVCTYEPVTINLSGAFVGNVTEVRYAGYVSTNNFHCSNSPSTTTITGVSPGITSVNFLPPSTLSNPNGYSSIVCAYSCSTTSGQGGCNTADQIKAYFEQSTGGTLTSYYTQYGCWSTSPYQLSAGGNCCSAPPCAIQANAGQDQLMCMGDSLLLMGSATGGATTYSWSPTAGVANPNAATTWAGPAVTTTYVLTASDGGNCIDTDTVVVTVHTAQASLSPIPDQCQNGDTVILTGGSPAGGSFVGSGVSNGYFIPSNAQIGQNVIYYSAMDSLGCFATATDTIEVFAPTTVILGAIGPFCESDPIVVLSNGIPAGGTYSGNGVSNGNFDPASAGAGISTITYDYQDANGCTSMASQTVSVIATPATPQVSIVGPELLSNYQGDSVQWFLNGSLVATGDSNYVPTSPGLYTAIVWVNGCPSLASAPVNVVLEALNDALPLGFELWPNPFASNLRFKLPEGSFDMELLDASGKLVREKAALQGENQFDWSDLAPGIYALHFKGENMRFAIKVQKL
jgi:hypothetical protein